ncbi:MAG: hypothetical protein KY455_13495 [Euryarchaeota archaeon]|nr:hypothetical protein [Euryarchaeota archaeon]
MNPIRLTLLAIGVALVLIGAFLFYFAADLDQWIPISVMTAGALIFVGLIVMGFAGSAATDRTNERYVERDVRREEPARRVEHREPERYEAREHPEHHEGPTETEVRGYRAPRTKEPRHDRRTTRSD